MTLRALAAACAAAAVLAPAAPSEAASVRTATCVRVPQLASARALSVTGDGFTPGALVTVRSTTPARPAPAYLMQATADTAGRFSATGTSPAFDTPATQQQTGRLVATENVNPALTATTTYRQVRMGYTTRPATGAASLAVTHTVRGLTAGRRTFLHFRLRGRTVGTVALGRASGACGTVSRRLALLPVTPIRTGIWTIFADQSRRFSARTAPQLRYSLPIT